MVTWVGVAVEVSGWVRVWGGWWFRIPGVPAGGPAEQTAGNKAGLQHAETQSSSNADPGLRARLQTQDSM